MPIYHHLGNIPQKRHTVFKSPKGNFYYEQLFGTEGFNGHSTLSYHVHRPTQVKEILKSYSVQPKIAIDKNIKSLLLKGFEIKPTADFLESRKTILLNGDCQIGLAAPTESLTYYTPKRYKSSSGQLLEHSPFCERDFKLPTELETYDEKGDFIIKIKKEGMIHEVVYATHPFDVVGWDGYNFPYGFSIHNFEPITGRVHQPPPVHQTFETSTFVVCSFVPRLYDYHPQSIPAPYNHSNIDSDEVLYYVDGDFMSRNNIEQGHITLHPKGIPHGPAPGAMERSIGQTVTQELAVMVDTFRPLMVTEDAMGIDDGKYYKSWVE